MVLGLNDMAGAVSDGIRTGRQESALFIGRGDVRWQRLYRFAETRVNLFWLRDTVAEEKDRAFDCEKENRGDTVNTKLDTDRAPAEVIVISWAVQYSATARVSIFFG